MPCLGELEVGGRVEGCWGDRVEGNVCVVPDPVPCTRHGL